MKVLVLNGSPHEKGCTYTTLAEVAGELNQAGVEMGIMHVDDGTVHGCMGCGVRGKLRKCIYGDDKANEVVEKMRQGDGLIVGSPIHYASTSRAITPFLDRFFYSGSSVAAHKSGTAIASVRRVGTTATLDQLSKYSMITQMPVVSFQYRNMMHGQCPEDVKKDEEGMQVMYVLGRNMARMSKSIETGKATEVTFPKIKEKKRTNPVRWENG